MIMARFIRLQVAVPDGPMIMINLDHVVAIGDFVVTGVRGRPTCRLSYSVDGDKMTADVFVPHSAERVSYEDNWRAIRSFQDKLCQSP
jgi:hypothetical protein